MKPGNLIFRIRVFTAFRNFFLFIMIVAASTSFHMKATPGRALPLTIGKEACPIFLGMTTLPRLIFLDLFFCLFEFIFLGSHSAENISG